MKTLNPQIKGHDLVQKQLCQALTQKRLPHALLLSGPSGIGKKELAWSLAQKLLCEKKPDQFEDSLFDFLEENSSEESKIHEAPACGLCFSCRQILKKQSEHVLEITHETLQIRLQDVKSIPAFLSLQSFSKAKIVLIDEVEKLNSQASNFLLKIIEEPPPKSHFFFISSNPSHLSLTFRSRIQNIRMKALPESLMRELSHNTKAWMIHGAKGRFDKLKELKEQGVLREKAFTVFKGLFQTSLAIDFSQYVKARASALDFVNFFQQFFRDLRILKSGMEDHLTHLDKKTEFQKLLFYPKELIDEWIQQSLQMEQELKANYDTILCFESFNISLRKRIKAFNRKQFFSGEKQ